MSNLDDQIAAAQQTSRQHADGLNKVKTKALANANVIQTYLNARLAEGSENRFGILRKLRVHAEPPVLHSIDKPYFTIELNDRYDLSIFLQGRIIHVFEDTSISRSALNLLWIEVSTQVAEFIARHPVEPRDLSFFILSAIFVSVLVSLLFAAILYSINLLDFSLAFVMFFSVLFFLFCASKSDLWG